MAASSGKVVYLSKEAILGVDDTRMVDVPVPEWGGIVRVRGLSAQARSEMEAKYMESVVGPGGKPKTTVSPEFRAALCAACIVDEAGDRVFSAEDVKALGDKNGANVELIFDAARKASGMTLAEEPDSVQAAAKN